MEALEIPEYGELCNLSCLDENAWMNHKHVDGLQVGRDRQGNLKAYDWAPIDYRDLTYYMITGRIAEHNQV